MSRVAPSAAHEGRASNVPVHFIYHVPKCAGQTIDGHFSSVLPGSAYYRTIKRRGPGRFLFTRHDLSKLADASRTRIVTGHYLGVSLDARFADRAIKRSVLLRDPVSHSVSYYNFRMMRYITEGLCPYSFKLAYEATQRNFITHYILRNFLEVSWPRLAQMSDEDKYDIANAFLASFWYVGDYRLCNEFIADLGRELGIPGRAQARNTLADWQRQVQWEPLTVGDLSASDVARIRQENQLDQRLWETWRDARHEAASVRPIPLGSRPQSGFLGNELRRAVSQVSRKFQRRFGDIGGPEMPAPQGSTALSA